MAVSLLSTYPNPLQSPVVTASGLLKKYDVPGPRYTSYPTILQWADMPTTDEWIESVSANVDVSRREGNGAAIYVHIPFCRSLCTYCGCNSRITSSTSVGRAYVKTVLTEWELYAGRVSHSQPIPLSELHLGGGTPTYLSPAELDELIGGILKLASKTSAAEFSVESDPRVTQPEHLSMLYSLGFRRLSLGIQDFDPVVQMAVNRVQTEEQVRAVTEKARALGFSSINYDLIYGLPFQNLQSIEQTVAAVTRLRPDRIAFYAYAHVPWVKPGQRHFTEEDLPAGDEKRALYELGRRLLEAEGYREIGMDHFALESDELFQAATENTLHRNFMGYAPRFVTPLIGLGVSSISDSWNAFVQNEKKLEVYEERVRKGEIPIFRGHKLNREDVVLRRHVLNLMTRFKTSWDTPEAYVPYLDSVAQRLEELERDELVQLTGKSCQVTAEGRAFLRNICMAFDARLARDNSTTQLFSRTI